MDSIKAPGGMFMHLLKNRSPVSLLVSTVGCDSQSATLSTISNSISSSFPDKANNLDTIAFCTDALDMRLEDKRFKSFDKWPLSFLSPQLLASNGFYYLGRGDEVRCAFCKVKIMKWVEGDDPFKNHQQWAPQCPFLKHKAGSGYFPLETTTADGRDECGIRARPTTTSTDLLGPVHPQYASEDARLRSFSDWPRSMYHKPKELAEAGFFYTGQGDKTKCFYCNGGLKDWEIGDIPWEQHARWFDRCAFVRLVKGREYVQSVNLKNHVIPTPMNRKDTKTSVPATEVCKSEKKQNIIDDINLCKICLVEERNVCFVPCGHVVACAKCALSTDKCPMCRRTFTDAVRLFFS